MEIQWRMSLLRLAVFARKRIQIDLCRPRLYIGEANTSFGILFQVHALKITHL